MCCLHVDSRQASWPPYARVLQGSRCARSALLYCVQDSVIYYCHNCTANTCSAACSEEHNKTCAFHPVTRVSIRSGLLFARLPTLLILWLVTVHAHQATVHAQQAMRAWCKCCSRCGLLSTLHACGRFAASNGHECPRCGCGIAPANLSCCCSHSWCQRTGGVCWTC
jgi:hypothetical protein